MKYIYVHPFRFNSSHNRFKSPPHTTGGGDPFRQARKSGQSGSFHHQNSYRSRPAHLPNPPVPLTRPPAPTRPPDLAIRPASPYRGAGLARQEGLEDGPVAVVSVNVYVDDRLGAAVVAEQVTAVHRLQSRLGQTDRTVRDTGQGVRSGQNRSMASMPVAASGETCP